MDRNLFISGANVVTLLKNNKKYAMTCAWAMMLDYDKACMLLGEQSITSNNIEIGDIIGISGASKENFDIIEYIGSTHSDEVDKFSNNEFIDFNGVKVIKSSKTKLKCKVENIIKINEGCNDKLLVLRVLNFESDSKKKFLTSDEINAE